MKKIFLSLFLIIALAITFAVHARAEVYGYILTISATKDGSTLQNNSVVPQSTIGTGVAATLRVIDPADPQKVVDATDWNIRIQSYNSTGSVLGASQDGYWSVSTRPTTNTNNLIIMPNIASGSSLDGYYFVLSAIASIGSRQTNSVSFRISTSNDIVTNDNTNSITNENTNTEIVVDTNTNTNSEEIITPPVEDKSPVVDLPSFFTSPVNALSQFTQNLGIQEKFIPATYSAVAAVAALATLPVAAMANLSTLFSTSELIRSYWYALFSFLGIRRRKSKWGRVIEAGTGLPLPGVKVSLIAIDSLGYDHVHGSYFTDKDGSYGFVAEPGKYKISVSKDNYHAVDAGYGYYEGGIVEVESYKKGLIISDIALVMNDTDVKRHFYRATKAALTQKVMAVFSFLFLALGSLLAVNALFKDSTTNNWLFMLVYLVLWIFSAKNLIKHSPWSSVRASHDKKPIQLALVRIIDKATKRLVQTVVTNGDGKFAALLGKGKFEVLVAKPGYEMQRPVDIDTKENINAVAKNIELDKKKAPSEQQVKQ